MSEIVFLLEEESMRELLRELLPRVLPEGIPYRLVPHEGKTDLERSLPRKLRAWRTPGVRFVVVRDKDSADCRMLKKKLVGLCSEAGRHDTLVRIVCHHLETWFLGDLAAVERAFNLPGLGANQGRRRYRNPDNIANASQELKRLVPNYQKVNGARTIAPHLDPERNCSHSFGIFIAGLARVVSEMTPGPR
ncbi:MAG TPA: DUF4276 family protein [Thermoanaerobaculia bacterium]|nr:DUF4276 family protein [Thermoanaerobaculia bacterium]